MSELKTLHTEIDALVSHCEEATRLLARQSVMDQVSDTLLRGRIEKLEKELDGVERIEETLEGMIGRMTVVRDLIVFEMSKLDALSQVSSQLKEKLTSTTQNQIQDGSSQPRKSEITSEMVLLQSLIGIGDTDDVRKILLKGDRLDKDLFESSLQNLKNAMNEMYTFPLN